MSIIEERLVAHCHKTEGCWYWTGRIDSNGVWRQEVAA